MEIETELYNCPICSIGIDKTEYSRITNNDTYEIGCKRCGDYIISDEMLRYTDLRKKLEDNRFALSGVVRLSKLRNLQKPKIFSTNIDQLLTNEEIPAKDDIDRKKELMVAALRALTTNFGDSVDLNLQIDYPLAFATGANEFKALLDLAKNEGLISIEGETLDYGLSVILSPDGYKYKFEKMTNIFISRDHPYGNIYEIKKVLDKCGAKILWLDKNFATGALDWIYEVAQKGKLKEVKILSLDMDDSSKKHRNKSYKKLKEELNNIGTKVEWRIIKDSTEFKGLHDRWVIGDAKYAVNIPDVNTISSGNISELIQTNNYMQALQTFKEYWEKGIEIC